MSPIKLALLRPKLRQHFLGVPKVDRTRGAQQANYSRGRRPHRKILELSGQCRMIDGERVANGGHISVRLPFSIFSSAARVQYRCFRF